MSRAKFAAGVLAGVLASPLPASAAVDPDTAALQIALRARGFYARDVDGRYGEATRAALRRFQHRARLKPTGVIDRRTRRALGAWGRPGPGKRAVTTGMTGWDVSVLEFELARRGFDVGRIDGRFDDRTLRALQDFQRFARLPQHCLATKTTFATVRRAVRPRVTIKLDWPVRGAVTRGIGIRGDRLHAGIDIAARFGVGVAAASSGRVAWAGWQPGGLGLVVRLVHKNGVETVYGHLARVDVKVGQEVVRGGWIGLVGKTGAAAKAGLHFEVRVRRAAVDPVKWLPSTRAKR